MENPISVIEGWLTYLNVELLGLKPFHFNAVKAPLLIIGFGILFWAVFAKSSGTSITRFAHWCRGLSSRTLTFSICGLLTVVLSYLTMKHFYLFTAEGYDLGIYSNVLWNTVNGNWYFSSLLNENFLSRHFGPVLIVFAPLYSLWESPALLLLVQSVALGLGGVALGLLTHRLTGNPLFVLVLLALYVSNPYLHTVATLDFHSVALAIPLFLWILYCLDTQRHWPALALATLVLLVEEGLQPGLAGLGIYLFLFRPQYRWTGAAVAVVATAWFFLVTTVYLAHSAQGALKHWHHYENLGPNLGAALYNLATNPLLLVTEAFFREKKLYYLAALFLSVGFLPIFAWRQATIVVLPVLAMLLSQSGALYKFGHFYVAMVLPFLFYSAAYGLANVREMIPAQWPQWVRSERVIFVVVMSFLIINVFQIRGYRLSHIDHEHVSAIRTVLASVPPRTNVRCEGNFLAMLSNRYRIAGIEEQIEKNFDWWTPEFFVFDMKYIDHDVTMLRARRLLISHLTEEDRYKLVAEQDGVMLFRARGHDRFPSASTARGPT